MGLMGNPMEQKMENDVETGFRASGFELLIGSTYQYHGPRFLV